MLYYHVTSRENVEPILKEGLFPGWGDLGFGVYLFNDVMAALDYAGRSGWDGELVSPVVLEISASADDVEPVIPHPDWPDPETYENVVWYPAEEADLAWHPLHIRLMEDQTPFPDP
ncbi:hypothetical protein [Pseudosulfitobacter pseudonitzschiae]|uniref:hypothetical protein n=1 Tax=Pseudosulfitobacter pseudonitzschiae TaxID=1402135 RepID=UPI003B7BFD85